MSNTPRTDEILEAVLRYRDVEDPCTTCRGFGTRAYSSTATWRGGMGGQLCTTDVCDMCWGTGDRHRRGADLRAMRNSEQQRIAETAIVLLANAAGAQIHSLHDTVEYLAAYIEKLARKRGAPAVPWLPEMATALAKTLRRGVERNETRDPAPTGP